MTRKPRFKEINCLMYKEEGPYCILCGAHMGMYYCAEGEPCFLNPHNWESYSNNTCPECGAEYSYDEGTELNLTLEDLEAIRKVRSIENGKPKPWETQWEDE